MKKLYTNGRYEVCERANGMLCIQFNPSKGEPWICANYEKTTDGKNSLKDDLAEFLVEDKVIKKSEVKDVYHEVFLAIGA